MLISKELEESRKEKIEDGKMWSCVRHAAEKGEWRIGACARREEESKAETVRQGRGKRGGLRL